MPEFSMPENNLRRWSQLPIDHEFKHVERMYPYNASVNDRFAIWTGNVSELQVDVVVNTTTESLLEINTVSEQIFSAAGSALKEEIITEGKECLPGEVCVTSGHSLQARHIVHTISPEYSSKNHCESEMDLANCYMKVLNKCKELKATSVALCLVHLNKRSFPNNLGVHVALRTIRAHLESAESPNLVVLWCNKRDLLSTVYTVSNSYFPKEIQPKYLQREIRIIHNPHEGHGSVGDDISLGDLDDTAASVARLHLGSDTQNLLGSEARFAPIADVMREQIEHQERYEKLLERAQTEDLNEVSGIGCLYQCGVDRLGRPVVVFVGKWFPVADINLDKALLYLIKLMDPIVRGDYVIAYFHTMTSSANYPPFSWLKEVYNVLPYKYKKNLKAFYIVHPTFWTKMMTWWFLTFMAPAIKQKVHNLPGIEYLYAVMTRDQLEIPAFITEYDMTINGLHYFQPDDQFTTTS